MRVKTTIVMRGIIMNSLIFDDLRKLGLNIAYYRKKNGLTQMQLAEKINISRTHMSRIETAECAPSVDVILKIAKILNVNPMDLFNFR